MARREGRRGKKITLKKAFANMHREDALRDGVVLVCVLCERPKLKDSYVCAFCGEKQPTFEAWKRARE